MATSDWIAFGAVCMAFLSLVIAAKSYLTAERIARANDDMARANQEMARAADVAAQSARELADIEAARDRAAKSARLVPQPDKQGSVITESIHLRRLTNEWDYLGIRLMNKGPVNAYVVQLQVAFNDGTIVGPGNGVEITSEDWRIPYVQIQSIQFGNDADKIAEFRVTYRDELGEGQERFRVRILGAWPDEVWHGSVLMEA